MAPHGTTGLSEYHEHVAEHHSTNVDKAGLMHPVAEKFVTCETNEEGVLSGVHFKNEDDFNFAYDIVDAMAEKCPDKTAMIYVDVNKNERRFTFKDIKRYSCQAANYFRSLGIKKGDRVMLVLKRHYQFWFSIIALHRIGALAIPASNMLKKHDLEYRFNSAQVSAIGCTADGGVADVMVYPDKIVMVLEDHGPGIPDVEMAMKEGFSTSTEQIRNLGFGAGMGLPNMKKNTDSLEIETEVGVGTKITMVLNV
jgi:hypothetical protein